MIRPAETKDIPRILALLSQVLELHASIRPDIFISGTTKYAAEDLEEMLIHEKRRSYVAVDEADQVVAYALCELKEPASSLNLRPRRILFVDDFCVDENARGQHVGTALFQYVRQEARALSCDAVELNVWEGNDAARAFYDRMGMRPKETRLEIGF